MHTLLIYIVILFYGGTKFVKMYARADTNFTQEVKANEFAIDTKFSFRDIGFNLAFGL